MSEETKQDELQIEDGTEVGEEVDAYFDGMKLRDQHEDDLQKRIKDRGRMVLMLFLILAGSVYANAYQLRIPKNIPYIYSVDNNGVVVKTILRRPDQIPPDDLQKQAFVRRVIIDWVTNARQRTKDVGFTIAGINTAIRTSAGEAQTELSMVVHKEDVAKSIGIQTRQVVPPVDAVPIWEAGNTWRWRWEEIVKGANGMEISREQWGGTFQIAEQPNWITELDPYGIHIVGKKWTQVSK